MGIADRRRAMRRPARVGDADDPVQRLGGEDAGEILQLPLGPPPLDRAAIDGGDAGAVITAIFEPLSPSNSRCATGSLPMIPTIPHMD